MTPICEQVVKIAAKLFIERGRDGGIGAGQDSLEGESVLEWIASNLGVRQFVDLRRLIVCVVDRALYNWFHLLQSTDEIRLLITPEESDIPVNITACVPHMPQCIIDLYSPIVVAGKSCFMFHYGVVIREMSLRTEIPVAPLPLPPLPEFPDRSVEWYGREAWQQEALDKFGFWLMRVVRDKTMDEWLSVMAGHEPPDIWLEVQVRTLPAGWAERLQQARQLGEDVLVTVLLDAIDAMLHAVLYDVEARSDCTIEVVTSQGRVADLSRIPIIATLASELFGEDGWIARFSRYPRAWVDRE